MHGSLIPRLIRVCIEVGKGEGGPGYEAIEYRCMRMVCTCTVMRVLKCCHSTDSPVLSHAVYTCNHMATLCLLA